MPDFLSRSSLFLEKDDEYPDLDYGKLATKRYIRLIRSADYYHPKALEYSERREELPVNLSMEGRKLTSVLKIKILGALAHCSLPSDFKICVYQLFHLVKSFGWRYNCKSSCWERDWNRL